MSTNQAKKDDEIISIKIDKKQLKILFYAALVVIGLAFIPFEKEISMPEHEHSKSFETAFSYKFKVYRTNTACLDRAIDKSGGQRDVYSALAKECKSIETKDVAEIIKFSNGPCNYRLDPDINIRLSDCEEAYIKDGKLYTRLEALPISGKTNEYAAAYDGQMDVRIVEGSSITYKTYYTKKCHAFGLICSSGEWLDDDTSFHERLIIGKNAKIKKYSMVCDGYSGKQMLNEENCIYADDTYKNVTIKDLL